MDLAPVVTQYPLAGPPAPSSDLPFQDMIERLERIEMAAKKAADRPSLAGEISKALMPIADRLTSLEKEIRELKKNRQNSEPVRQSLVAAPAVPVNLVYQTPAAPCVVRGWSFVGTHRNAVWLQREGASSPIRYELGETVQSLGRLLEVKQDGAGQWYVDINSGGGSGSCRISQSVK
ncbi:hypothetical protein [Niveispirillum sp. SYP-B3756]|uniref:hypothetical protein n=1 Tax=Niveispirillum sp. SYP-B3756 TaxID=2662178 RepID=UPI001B3BD6EB|nr:hypothetical protein [Niveispirillum sp. SYP-B3756]